MTLIVAVGTPDQVVISTDTRLSWNGEIVDDASCKLAHYNFFDGTLLGAYSGLARWSDFVTRDFIQNAVADVAKPWTATREVLSKLTHALNNEFENNRSLTSVPEQAKGLALVFGGYIDRKLVLASISNNLDKDGCSKSIEDEFTLTIWDDLGVGLEWAFVQGATDYVPDGAREELYEMARTRKPLDAIKGKTHSVITTAAIRAKSVNACILTGTLRPDGTCSSWYSPEHGGQVIMAPDEFTSVMSGDGNFKLNNIKLIFDKPLPARTAKRGRNGKHTLNKS